MKLSHLVAAVSISLAAGSFTATAAEHGSIDKVLGSATVDSNQHYADISLVNGSLDMASNSSAKNVSLVNGSIELASHVSIDSASTVNGSISAGGNLSVQRDLTTVNGKIYPGVNAVIGGHVETVNGDIRLENSEVGKDITTVNGDITLDGNSVVKGDIVYKPRGKRRSLFSWGNNDKPVLRIAANATVEGNIVLQQEVELQLENTALQDKVIYQINDGR
jgi:DUF4097 and DUF4098 domain-containing protein YvlB